MRVETIFFIQNIFDLNSFWFKTNLTLYYLTNCEIKWTLFEKLLKDCIQKSITNYSSIVNPLLLYLIEEKSWGNDLQIELKVTLKCAFSVFFQEKIKLRLIEKKDMRTHSISCELLLRKHNIFANKSSKYIKNTKSMTKTLSQIISKNET